MKNNGPFIKKWFCFLRKGNQNFNIFVYIFIIVYVDLFSDRNNNCHVTLYHPSISASPRRSL